MKASGIVASVFGVGFFPAAQGTIMSAIAVPLAFLISLYSGGLHGSGLAVGCASMIVFTIGIFASEEYMRDTGKKDPPECVIDELAGQWFACAFVPLSLPAYIVAFGLFRLFDIWKPWPISYLETVPGGWGVMLDDMGAGLAAGIIVWLAVYFHLL